MLEMVKLATTPPPHAVGMAVYFPHLGWLLALGGLLVGCAAAMASLITGTCESMRGDRMCWFWGGEERGTCVGMRGDRMCWFWGNVEWTRLWIGRE